MSRPDRYTDELGARIRAEYERGTSCQEVAEMIDVSYSAARRWLIRAGTEMRAATRPPKVAPAPVPRATGTVMSATFTPRVQGRGFSNAMAIRTTCKVCRHGITDTDATVWRTSTPLGLVHAYCDRGQ